MRPVFLADTGLLIAFLHRKDRYHGWAVEQFRTLRLPFLTCDAVLTEATYLLDSRGLPREHVLALVAAGSVRVAFDPNAEAEALSDLLARYASTPMDYADACLVRMSERYEAAEVLTVDSDFHVYRRHKKQAIAVRMPEDRSRA